MKKSVQQQLLDFLRSSPGLHPSGDLQRRLWTNKDGTTAVPRTIVRRLQELAEDGKIFAEIVNGHTLYHADPKSKEPVYAWTEVKTPEGYVMKKVLLTK